MEEGGGWMTESAPDLSIIIPAYNEELRLPGTLEKIASFLRQEPATTEVLVVDDGSSDKTLAVAESFRGKIPQLRVISNGTNRGKGYSVRNGIEESRKLVDALKTHDVAIGSRAMDRGLIGVHESLFREFAGIVFNKIVRFILWLPFVDTQCGFKAFRMDRCRILFEQQTIERFGFDPELLYLARHHGLSIVEVPVRWSHSPATKVSMLRDSVQMFLDVFVIRWNSLKGSYRRK
jgi:dolichyl-phosphate beta-glucosyltransferase